MFSSKEEAGIVPTVATDSSQPIVAKSSSFACLHSSGSYIFNIVAIAAAVGDSGRLDGRQ
jgi:hypothetical protein